MLREQLAGWPVRRRVATALLTLPVLALYLAASGRAPLEAPLGWLALTALAAVLGAAVLAGYVPVAGRGLDLGCTPCATMSAVTVIGATIGMRTHGLDLTGPAIAIAVTLFGLTQRVGQANACAVPAARPQDPA